MPSVRQQVSKPQVKQNCSKQERRYWTECTELCVAIWETGEWSEEWTFSTFIPLPKKGDLKQCANYRTIALVSHARKILLRIILERIRVKTERTRSSAIACKDRSLYKCFEYLLTKLSSNINVLIIFRWSLTLAVFETTAENNRRNSTKLNSLLSIIHGTSYRQLNNRTVQLLTI